MAVVRPFRHEIRGHDLEMSPSVGSTASTGACSQAWTPEVFTSSRRGGAHGFRAAIEAEPGDPEVAAVLRQLPVWERLARLEESLSGCPGVAGTSSPISRPREAGEVVALKRCAGPRMDVMDDAQGLHDRLAMMDERSRLLGAEARDLQDVIATKDGVIRRLGSSLDSGASQLRELRDVVSTKDGIIRLLQTELNAASSHGHAVSALHSEIGTARRAVQTQERDFRALQDQLGHTREILAEREQQLLNYERSVSPDASRIGLPEDGGGRDSAFPDEQRYTAFPVNVDVCYVPVPGCVLDLRIAAFLNGRDSRIFFTRVDGGGIYLYGRLAVRCWLGDCGGVVVRPRGGTQLPLAEFVTRHEDVEHAHFEMSLFQRPSG